MYASFSCTRLSGSTLRLPYYLWSRSYTSKVQPAPPPQQPKTPQQNKPVPRSPFIQQIQQQPTTAQPQSQPQPQQQQQLQQQQQQQQQQPPRPPQARPPQQQSQQVTKPTTSPQYKPLPQGAPRPPLQGTLAKPSPPVTSAKPSPPVAPAKPSPFGTQKPPPGTQYPQRPNTPQQYPPKPFSGAQTGPPPPPPSQNKAPPQSFINKPAPQILKKPAPPSTFKKPPTAISKPPATSPASVSPPSISPKPSHVAPSPEWVPVDAANTQPKPKPPLRIRETTVNEGEEEDIESDRTVDAKRKSSRVGGRSEKGGTFVSAHFRVDEDTIKQYLQRKQFPFRASGNEIVLKDCTWCPDTKGKQDNLWKLYISREHGAYLCHRCGSHGSWFDFKKKLGDLREIAAVEKEEVQLVLPNQDLVNTYPKNLDLPSFSPLLEWLSSTSSSSTRHISHEILHKYEVGATTCKFPSSSSKEGWKEHVCVTFPWISVDSQGNRKDVLRVKLRSMEEKGKQRIEPKGGGWGLFGWHTIPKGAREIVITEGEFDAMAVHQATKMPAVSLPNGASSLPPQVLSLLEKFERIYLWMDDDVPGQEGAKKFAQKLGSHRCYIVHAKETPGGPKDANDALRMGKNLMQMIEKAKRPSHDQIVTFEEIRTQIETELINPTQTAGVKSMWLPSMNTLLKGHRLGEITVLSGLTGIGKTSILSQLSVDYSLQGVRTLWGSFELQLPKLVRKMLCQYSGKNIEKLEHEEYETIADQFGALPLYFLRFFGSTQVDQVVDAMEYAVYVHDVEHIILDNLQFMISHQGKGSEKFDIMDEAIHKFRQFATNNNVHITLVIHPRKQDQDMALTVSDIFGNAKATQEADNVILLQQGKQSKYLDIKKNRFSGDLGKIPLTFDKESSRFQEVLRKTTSDKPPSS